MGMRVELAGGSLSAAAPGQVTPSAGALRPRTARLELVWLPHCRHEPAVSQKGIAQRVSRSLTADCPTRCLRRVSQALLKLVPPLTLSSSSAVRTPSRTAMRSFLLQCSVWLSYYSVFPSTLPGRLRCTSPGGASADGVLGYG